MTREQGSRAFLGPISVCLGDALVGLGSLDKGAEAYRRALVLLRELGQVRYAQEALAGLACVCLAQGDLPQAQTLVEEIYGYLQNHTLGNISFGEGPLHVYLTCYRVLQASGDPRADGILEEAHSLLQERAAKISDEEERRSYLENVAANREIVEEWAGRE